jgi:hypothetical protein
MLPARAGTLAGRLPVFNPIFVADTIRRTNVALRDQNLFVGGHREQISSAVPLLCDKSGCRLGPEKLTVGLAECRFYATAATTVDDFGFEAAAFGLDAPDIVTEIVDLLLHRGRDHFHLPYQLALFRRHGPLLLRPWRSFSFGAAPAADLDP